MHHRFRTAAPEDTALLLSFIRELAAYEHMLEDVVATEAILREWLFEKQRAEAFFVLDQGVEVGFALYFYNFSTFLGRAGIYLEDLFVKPAYRKLGYGKAILRELARRTAAAGCGRLEWACLNWNTPSIAFYTSLGAQPMNDWTVYRLSGDSLRQLATASEGVSEPAATTNSPIPECE